MSELRLLGDLRKFVLHIYKLSYKLPEQEKFNLTSQIRRAVISVSLNVREGNAFRGKKRLNFFSIALGSLYEVDECFKICLDLKYFELKDFMQYKDIYWECHNKLKKLIKSNKEE